jgi:hypothetical protein
MNESKLSKYVRLGIVFSALVFDTIVFFYEFENYITKFLLMILGTGVILVALFIWDKYIFKKK